MWYFLVKYYDWVKRKLKILVLFFIYMIWFFSNFVGVGFVKLFFLKFYVVVYFDLMLGNKELLFKDNVLLYIGLLLIYVF